MGPATMAAARQAAATAIGEIVDGVWFAVIAGSDRAMLAYPPVTSGPGMVQATAPEEVTAIVNVGDDVILHGLHVSPDIGVVELLDEAGRPAPPEPIR